MSNTDATFTEVLQIGVDTDLFAQQMKEVERIYAESLKNMPSLDKVAGVSVADAVKNLNDTVQKLSSGAADVLTNLATVTTESTTKMSQSMATMAQSVTTSLAQVQTAVKQNAAAQQQAASAGSSFSGFWGGLTSNIAKSAGSLTKSLLLYKAFNEALALTTDAVMAPFKAIGDGYKYLENVQDRASIIQAALLQSVAFSKDWGTNVKIAGDEADRLVKKVDDFAVKLHVNSQTIQTGLTTFLEAGGANLVKSLDDAVGVSALATGALQSQNPNLESRKLVGEIQKLVQGSATDSSKLATALGLSKDQMKEMVEHAQKYHDLYQEILAFAPGIVERLGDANNRQTSLVATLELYKTRWESLIAGPLFDRFTTILQNVLHWLDAHEDQMTNIGKSLGHMVDLAAQFATNFIQNNWEGVVLVFKDLAKLAIAIGSGLAGAAADAIAIAQLKEATGNAIAGPKGHDAVVDKYNAQDNANESLFKSGKITEDEYWKRNKEGLVAMNAELDKLNANSVTFTSTWKEWKKNQDGMLVDAHKVFDEIDKLGSDTSKQPSTNTPAPSWWTTHGINTKAPKQSNAGLHSDMQDWRDDLDKTKQAYQEYRDDIQKSLSTNVINHQQASEQIRLINKYELESVDALIVQYTKKLEASGAKKEQIAAAVKDLRNLRDQLQGTLSHGEREADRGAGAESVNINRIQRAGERALTADENKDLQRQHQEAARRGDVGGVSAFDTESKDLRDAHTEERQQLQEEADSYATGTEKRQQAINKLNLFDQQYTEQVADRSRQRIEVLKKEREAQEQFDDKMQTIALERSRIVSEGRNSFDPSDKENRNQQIIAQEISLTTTQMRSAEANLAEAKAKNANSDATRKLAEELGNLQNKRIQQGIQAIQAAGQGTSNPVIARQAEQIEAKKQVDSTTGDTQAAIKKASQDLGLSLDQVQQKLKDTLLGPDFDKDWETAKDVWEQSTDSMGKLNGAADAAAAGLSGLTSLGKAISGAFSQYRQGSQQGGVLGGIGSLLSSGPVSEALGMIPVVGQLVAPLGQAFSFIGDMFVSQAKKIAENIDKAVQKINNAYSDGALTLQQTIAALQAQRQSAITQLSGQKGGQDQLNKLLPGLDQEIASLQYQVKQISVNFDASLFALSQGGKALTQWVTTWQQINAQVKQYIDAGGSQAEANTFLQLQLGQQLLTLQNNLNQGQQQAIQDALQLNQLQQQKIDLVKQEAATEFGLLTGDAIEKRTSNAVKTAITLQQQRDQYSQQLQQLNSQLSLKQQEVAMESQIFTIANNTAALQEQSNQLTLASLAQQLDDYKQMQEIIADTSNYNFNGTTFTSTNPYIPGYGNTGINNLPTQSGGGQAPTGGSIGPAPGTGNGGVHPVGGPVAPVGGTPNISLVVNVDNTNNANGAVDGQVFSKYLAAEIQTRLRVGRSTF